MDVATLSDDQVARVLGLIDKGDGEACWIWTGTVTHQGYGQTSLNHRSVRAHVAVYSILVGPVAPGKILCHTCDVRLCVRPDHLYQGTHAENQDDTARRNRSARGEANRGGGKLTEADVRAIRRRIEAGDTYRTIGSDFGVSGTQISYIATGKQWSHVT